MLRDDKYFKVLIIILAILLSLIINFERNGFKIEEPHPVYDSIYYQWRNLYDYEDHTKYRCEKYKMLERLKVTVKDNNTVS